MIMRIVYCTNAVCYSGGIDRVVIVKANALAELPEMEVYIVVTDHKDGFLIHPLSPKVHLIDLNVNYVQIVWKSKV